MIVERNGEDGENGFEVGGRKNIIFLNGGRFLLFFFRCYIIIVVFVLCID